MTQQERDMMVERYIDGTMSQPERHEFLDLLDRDEGLRQALRAETLINNAVRGDRTAMPMPSAASRERFLTMLATVAPEGATPGTGSPESPGATGKGAMAPKGVIGSGGAKAIVSTLAGLAITIGAIVFVPKLVESPAPKAPALAPQPQEAQPAPQVTTAPQPAETAPQAISGEPATTVETRTTAPAARKRSADAEIEPQKRANVTRKNTAPTPEHQGSSEPVKKEDPKLINGETPTRLNIKNPVVKN